MVVQEKTEQQQRQPRNPHYDCVVIGAGTAAMGALRAFLEGSSSSSSSLHEDEDNNNKDGNDHHDDSYPPPSRRRPLRIAVLEKGASSSTSSGDKLIDWYWTAHNHHRDPSNNNNSTLWNATMSASRRRVKIPIGQGRGGTTRINAGLCCAWKSTSKDKQNHASSPNDHDCNMKGTKPQEDSLFSLLLENAMQHLQRVLEQNGVFQSRPVSLIVQPRDGRRINYYQGLVEPLLRSSSNDAASQQQQVTIEWIEGVTCRRILYSNTNNNHNNRSQNQVAGVEYFSNNDLHQWQVLSTSRILLSAGVFGSPVILMASDLIPNNNTNNNDHQAVFFMQDHVMIPAAFWGWKQRTNNNQNNNNNENKQSLDSSTPSSSSSSWNGVKNMPQIQLNQDYTFQWSEMEASLFPRILPSLAVDYLFHRTTGTTTTWPVGMLPELLLLRPIELLIRMLLYLLLSPWSPLHWILSNYVTVVGIFLVQSTPTPFNGSFCVNKKNNSDHDDDGNEWWHVRDIRLDYLRSEKDLQAVQEFWQTHLRTDNNASHPDIILPRSSWEFFPGPWVRKGWALDRPLHPDRFRMFCQEFCLPYFHWCGSLADRYANNDDDSNAEKGKHRLPRGLWIADASTLHPLPPVPPALTLAAHGYLVGQKIMAECLPKKYV